MNLQKLRDILANVMPILDSNLAAAHREYMNGEIAAGAYGFVRQRHENAVLVLADDAVSPVSAYKACAPLAIDLRSGLGDMQGDDFAGAVDAWWVCYREAGFTLVHKAFDFPVMPDDGSSVPPVEPVHRDDLPVGAYITQISPQRGSVLEPGVPEVEVLEGGSIDSKKLSVEMTVERLKSLVRAGIAVLDSTSGCDPDLFYRYDHYIVV